MDYIQPIIQRFRDGQRTRVLAFGSSNTERIRTGMHWFDYLDVAIRCSFGRVRTFINTGVGGDTAGQMLNRFDDDAARYEPHLAFVTVGGNDSFVAQGISVEQFASNLTQIHDRFKAMGTLVVFQTYYAPCPLDPAVRERFDVFMQAVRQVASATGAGLIDHLPRWTLLQSARPDLYQPLMHDPFHLNARGNAVLGADLVRHFEAEITDTDFDVWQDALRIQQIMDELADATES